MKLKVTGDIDFIAHSAWISTIGEMRAKARTEEDQERVVAFLIEHHHTSPLEGVTLTFYDFNKEDRARLPIAELGSLPFARMSKAEDAVTIDLLNFCKATKCDKSSYFGDFWNSFLDLRPKLGSLLSKFGEIKEDNPSSVEKLLGNHNMSVQLVQFHDGGSLEHSRASWRVRCPLSVSVQILRHRTGSYNQVSGRYKTIRQKMFESPEDCKEIAEKIGENIDKYMGVADAAIAKYLQFMKKAKLSRDNNIISNDEYKRLREVARFILPEGRMTELYITYYLDDFYNNYLKLRDSKHAQTEHIWIAQEMRKTLEQYEKENI